MSPSSQPELPRSRRGRRARVLTGAVAMTVAAGVVLAAGGQGAVAAGTSQPVAQSVGRFVDGSAGGMPIQKLADLHDARAYAPGSTSQQNPLHATLLGQADVPIGHALQLPGGGVFKLGAANQVAHAQLNGYSYGASGAVANSGGASLGGNNNAYPADATIDLSSDALGSVKIPGVPKLPGVPGVPPVPKVPAGSAPALGGVTAQIGAVSGLAQTLTGGNFATPHYQIAGLTLQIGSPILGQLLQQLASGGAAGRQQLTALLQPVLAALDKVGKSPNAKDCSAQLMSVPGRVPFDSGFVTLDGKNATISVDIAKLLSTLGLNLDTLPPNTDLLAYVLNNLGRLLSRGLENVVNGIIGPLEKQGQTCLRAIEGIPGVGKILDTLLTQLKDGQKEFEDTVNMFADQLSKAGSSGLTQLTDNLAKVVAIGVNVQQGAFPLSSEPSPKYRFSSVLKATPDQATAIVGGQGVERALEIDLAGGQVGSLALGNAAAGPFHPRAAPPTTQAPPSNVPANVNTNIPTGIPAGMAGHGGSPALPLTLLVLGLLVAGGGAMAWRLRAGRRAG